MGCMYLSLYVYCTFDAVWIGENPKEIKTCTFCISFFKVLKDLCSTIIPPRKKEHLKEIIINQPPNCHDIHTHDYIWNRLWIHFFYFSFTKTQNDYNWNCSIPRMNKVCEWGTLGCCSIHFGNLWLKLFSCMNSKQWQENQVGTMSEVALSHMCQTVHRHLHMLSHR